MGRFAGLVGGFKLQFLAHSRFLKGYSASVHKGTPKHKVYRRFPDTELGYFEQVATTSRQLDVYPSLGFETFLLLSKSVDRGFLRAVKASGTGTQCC